LRVEHWVKKFQGRCLAADGPQPQCSAEGGAAEGRPVVDIQARYPMHEHTQKRCLATPFATRPSCSHLAAAAFRWQKQRRVRQDTYKYRPLGNMTS